VPLLIVYTHIYYINSKYKLSTEWTNGVYIDRGVRHLSATAAVRESYGDERHYTAVLFTTRLRLTHVVCAHIIIILYNIVYNNIRYDERRGSLYSAEINDDDTGRFSVNLHSGGGALRDGCHRRPIRMREQVRSSRR